MKPKSCSFPPSAAVSDTTYHISAAGFLVNSEGLYTRVLELCGDFESGVSSSEDHERRIIVQKIKLSFPIFDQCPMTGHGITQWNDGLGPTVPVHWGVAAARMWTDGDSCHNKDPANPCQASPVYRSHARVIRNKGSARSEAYLLWKLRRTFKACENQVRYRGCADGTGREVRPAWWTCVHARGTEGIKGVGMR